MSESINIRSICRKSDRKGERNYRRNGGHIYTSKHAREIERTEGEI